jgi:thermolysin
VTEFTSGLVYQDESGALNESFSDMMSAGAEFFFQTPGDGPLRADYLLAEDISTAGGIRSMANPRQFNDPDHYSVRFTGPEDNGGVHINSGIPNHAFFLAIEGGTNRTSGLSVQGVGAANREQIEKVMYRAFTQMMPARATFAVARQVTLQSARDLYGAGSAPERALTQAWTAVGVQ